MNDTTYSIMKEYLAHACARACNRGAILRSQEGVDIDEPLLLVELGRHRCIAQDAGELHHEALHVAQARSVLLYLVALRPRDRLPLLETVQVILDAREYASVDVRVLRTVVSS